MFKKGFTLVAAISLVSLGVGALASCGKGEAASPIHFLGLNENNSIDVKVDAPYTVSIKMDEGYEDSTVLWTSNASSKVELEGDNSSVSITVSEVGTFIITASINTEGVILSNNFTVNATRGVETYALAAEFNGTTSFKQGQAFTTRGLSVKKVKSVDGVPTKNAVELSSTDYTLSIQPGTILTEVGEIEVIVTALDTTIAPTSFKINVEAEPGYLLTECLGQIGENYTAFMIGEDGLAPLYCVNEDYYFDYSLGEGYYLEDGEVRRYSIDNENSTENNIIFQKRAKVSDGFNSDKTPHYATTLEYPMAGLGYTHASGLEYSSSDVLQYKEVEGDNMFAISTNLATQLLGVFGFGVLALNYDISSAIVADTTLELENGTTLPLVLSQVVLSSNGQNIGGLAFGLSFFGTSGEPIIDAFIEDENKSVNEAVDTELTIAQEIVGSNCFTARYGETPDGSYSTYSIDSKSIEWYDHSVQYGDNTMGIINIPEGKNVSAGYYQYGLNADGEVEIDTTKPVNKQVFDFYTPSNWYGFSKEDSALGLNFDNMWLFTAFYQGDAVKKEAAYAKYTLYHQGIAETWSSQAFLYSDAYFDKLSEHGYSFVGISFYLLDTDLDGNYDSFEIGLECTSATIVGYGTWDILSIDSSSVGGFSNTKVDTYLSSITPEESGTGSESGEAA